MNNKNREIPSVFTYKYFWIAIIIPISISLTLMCFIWINDNLTLQWPNKNSLNTFLNFMSVPLWILGSSIPFATLAAANFRAIQFQENLEYQKCNLERQEYEHSLDIYHKELSIFREKLLSIIVNLKFKKIKPEDATILFSSLYQKPTKGNKEFKADEDFINKLKDYKTRTSELAWKLFENIDDAGHLNCLKEELKKVFQNKFGFELVGFDNLYNKQDLCIIIYLCELDHDLRQILAVLGVKAERIGKSKLLEILRCHHEITIIYQYMFAPRYVSPHLSPEKMTTSEIFNYWSNDCSKDLDTKFKKMLEEAGITS